MRCGVLAYSTEPTLGFPLRQAVVVPGCAAVRVDPGRLLYSLLNVAGDSRARTGANRRGAGPSDSAGNPASRIHSQGDAPQRVRGRQTAAARALHGGWPHGGRIGAPEN